jgi:ketosteroid isomerase-like protein
VKAAARDLVAAFATHDRARYFDSFAPNASFIFYSSDRVFQSRAEYEAEWKEWEATGFKVLACTSLNSNVTVLTPEVAVFTHQVRTKLNTADGVVNTGERETIVFQLFGAKWLGVHEHLSLDPTFTEGQ